MKVKETYDEAGRVKFLVTTPKSKIIYSVQKSRDGYVFYEIKGDKGAVPDKLSGRYTQPELALKALTVHLKSIPETSTVRRDNRTAQREKAKLDAKAKVNPDNTDDLQQGLTN